MCHERLVIGDICSFSFVEMCTFDNAVHSAQFKNQQINKIVSHSQEEVKVIDDNSVDWNILE